MARSQQSKARKTTRSDGCGDLASRISGFGKVLYETAENSHSNRVYIIVEQHSTSGFEGGWPADRGKSRLAEQRDVQMRKIFQVLYKRFGVRLLGIEGPAEAASPIPRPHWEYVRAIQAQVFAAQDRGIEIMSLSKDDLLREFPESQRFGEAWFDPRVRAHFVHFVSAAKNSYAGELTIVAVEDQSLVSSYLDVYRRAPEARDVEEQLALFRSAWDQRAARNAAAARRFDEELRAAKRNVRGALLFGALHVFDPDGGIDKEGLVSQLERRQWHVVVLAAEQFQGRYLTWQELERETREFWQRKQTAVDPP